MYDRSGLGFMYVKVDAVIDMPPVLSLQSAIVPTWFHFCQVYLDNCRFLECPDEVASVVLRGLYSSVVAHTGNK